MTMITWSSEFSVGIGSIDEQHKKLVGLVNDLNDAMGKGKGKDVLEKILAGLVDYTKTHFANEEQLFKTLGYPESMSHKTKHDELTKKVLQFQKDLHDGKVVMSVEIMAFLKDWLLNHIKGTDMKYSSFMKSKGVA
ncbi:MAG TPA: bacteriohemerythrin [Dissulfurispiraceae bacterium]|nr:bacteriohemerythrin [Dissulfurispiraceae bacterium]